MTTTSVYAGINVFVFFIVHQAVYMFILIHIIHYVALVLMYAVTLGFRHVCLYLLVGVWSMAQT